MALRGLGLYCFFLGMLACSTTPQNTVVQPSKKASQPNVRTYVGLKTPPMPQGHETELGYLLGPEDQGKYSVEVVSFGSKKIVWMGRLLYHDEKGRAHWEIVAALPPQQLPVGHRFSGGNCLNQNKPQPEIVAILKKDKKEAATQIHIAWKADPINETFELLPLEGIQCHNERMKH